MKAKGVQGSVGFDDGWITITKKEIGKQDRVFRIRAADVTGVRFKPATRLFHGYVQFVLPGSAAAPESTSLLRGGRPPQCDPHSLSIPYRSNDAAGLLIASVEEARPTR